MVRTVVFFAALLTLAACAATQTVYAPASGADRAVGYSDLRIEADRWRVTFTAGPDLSTAQSEQLALRRAAELTLEAGYDWFEVVQRRLESEGRDSPVSAGGSLGTTIGSGGYSGTSVGIGIGLSTGRERRTQAVLEIVAGAGEPHPEGAYDARSVLENAAGLP